MTSDDVMALLNKFACKKTNKIEKEEYMSKLKYESNKPKISS